MQKTKLIIILQARLSSKRFAGKVLEKIMNKPLLNFIIESLKYHNKLYHDLYLVTADQKSDDVLANFCKKNKIKFIRGDLENVASRYLQICNKKKFSHFVRISCDSPLIDFNILNDIKYKIPKYEIITNCLNKTFPKGQSIEVVSRTTFKEAYKKFNKKAHFEHVTKYFYDNYKYFNIFNFKNKKNFRKLNMAIDYKRDIKNIEFILNKLKKNHYNYNYKKFINLLNEKN